jgi:membrane dipeptidase
VIDYGVKLVGEDQMALGSDFDGGPLLEPEIRDISDYPEITKALEQLGFSRQPIRKLLGLNWLRVSRQARERGR